MRYGLISRKTIVPIVVTCLAVAALCIPIALHLPRFIEIELVLGAWWLIWTVTLFILLYRGHKVDDDTAVSGWSSSRFGSLDGTWADSIGCVGDGCAEGFGYLVAGIFVIIGILLLVELIIPGLIILLLLSIGGMTARAINDRHDCDGRFVPSLLWSVVWSTVYTGPLIAIVVAISAYLRSTGKL